MTSYRKFTMRQAVALIAWYLGDGAPAVDHLEAPARDWPTSPEIDQEIWTLIRDEKDYDEAVPSEMDLNTFSDMDWWLTTGDPGKDPAEIGLD